MAKLRVRLPDSLHKQLRECARREGTSINQLISSAVAEKLAALLTEDYLAERAKRGSRKKFLAALKSAPDVEPEAFDRLSGTQAPPRRRPSQNADA
ncbi:MAG: toxin-antitoxin system HicB family antitoxin [Planctomycetia bacterium]|nr:toxin-antitoxin system HicB family antitoxin [Planctomycetia bacterium]